MSGKRKIKEKRVAGGVPLAEISLSLRSCLDSLFDRIETIGASARSTARDHLTGHLYETIDRLCNLAFQKKDTVAAWRATQTLSALVSRCINPLIGIASVEQDTIGKRWAGESLARVWIAVEKHTETLNKVNSAYRKTKAKMGKHRRDIVAAPRPIGQIVQKELATAERYRHELLFYRRLRLLGKNQNLLIKTQIPGEYRLTLKLPDFSEKSWPEWWEFLWPIIRKKINVAKLDSRYEMARKRYASDSDKTARGHLKLLAQLRSNGVL
jgi:hypothetical protein